ncbi:MAG TPA: hypothetical protein PKN62_01600 [bacterium]|nr:hypothetical protein [bacterium]
MKKELFFGYLFLLIVFFPVAVKANNQEEAAIIFQSGTKAQVIVSHSKNTRSAAEINSVIKTFVDPFKELKNSTASQKQAIANFISYGTLGTQKLNQAARYRMVLAYRVKQQKFPASQADWLKLLNQPPGLNVWICGVRVGDKHEVNVKESFLRGFYSYKKDLTPDLITISTSTLPDSCFQDAESNNYPIAVMSIKDADYYNSIAQQYNKVVMFMPAGSNSFQKVFHASVTSAPVVITGAGDKHNKTGYNVEFFSINPLDKKSFVSSYSNGYIAGQIAYIAKKLDIPVSQARAIARKTASLAGVFTAEDGFGQIQIEAALKNTK